MTEKNKLSRRAALARLGLGAAAVYMVPSMTTLGMAHASEASKPSEPSKASEPSRVSAPSEPSEPSKASVPSEPSTPSEASSASMPSLPSGVDVDAETRAAFDTCANSTTTVEELAQCLTDAGLDAEALLAEYLI